MELPTLPEVLQSPEGATLTALVVGSALKFLWLRHVRCVREQLFTFVGNVSELNVYPVKGCKAVELQSATATTTGLTANGFHDRQWMIESCDREKCLNLKQCPQFTQMSTAVDGDFLVISAPGISSLRVPRKPDPAKFKKRTISRDGITMEVLDCGSEANDWMSRFLGQSVRLLHSRPEIASRDAYETPLPWETLARKGDKFQFQYKTSYFVVTSESVNDLNRRLANPVTTHTFRPNIVVNNGIPFDEDTWDEIRIGSSAKFHYVQPCRRCSITNVDPWTGQRREDKEPMATLRKYRTRDPYGSSPLFGVYIALDNRGPINVGDPVYVIRRQPTYVI